MISNELAHAEKVIIAALDEQSIPHPESMQWMPTPFKGQWGFGSNVCFQAAALEARSGKKINVPEREINVELSEEEIARRLGRWQPLVPRTKTGFLALYSQLALPPEQGGAMQKW